MTTAATRRQPGTRRSQRRAAVRAPVRSGRWALAGRARDVLEETDVRRPGPPGAGSFLQKPHPMTSFRRMLGLALFSSLTLNVVPAAGAGP